MIYRRLIIASVILLICVGALPQNSEFEELFDSEGAKTINDIIESSSGNLYVLGEKKQSSLYDSTLADSYQAILYKLSPEGELIWTKLFPSCSSQFSAKDYMVETETGHLILAGESKDHAYLYKISPDGDSIWAKSFDMPPLEDITPVHSGILKSINNKIYFSHISGMRHMVGPTRSCIIGISPEGEKFGEVVLNDFLAGDILPTKNQLFVVGDYKSDISLLTYDLNLNFENRKKYPHVSAYNLKILRTNFEEMYIMGFLECYQEINPHMSGILFLKTDSKGDETLTKKIPGIFLDLYTLKNGNILTFSLDLLIRVYSNDGDSVNGHVYPYKPIYSSAPTFNGFPEIYCSENHLFLAGRMFNNDKFLVSKLNVNTFSQGNYEMLDKFNSSVDIFPNPATEYVYLSFNWLRISDYEQMIFPDNVEIVIYDMRGKLILDEYQYLNNNLLKLRVSEIPDGTYYLKIHFPDGKVISQKIVVIHPF